MLIVVVGALVTAVWAGYVYLWREQLGLQGAAMSLLRTIGVSALLVLLVNPGRASRLAIGAPVVLLDASLSMGVGGNWSAAIDTASALAGPDGTILRFGSWIAPFDTQPPRAGATRLGNALRVARAAEGPIHVVTDGEVEDMGAILPDLLADIRFVVLPRDTVVDAAVLDVSLPRRIQQGDSVRVEITVGVWGTNAPRRAEIEIVADHRIVAAREVDLPMSPGVSRRSLAFGPGQLSAGDHVLGIRVNLDGDAVPEDDERQRIVTVTEHPAVVMLADSPDWESRFFVSELTELVGTTVKAYAHVIADEWIDMHSLEPIIEGVVRREASRAGLLATRAESAVAQGFGTEAPALWRWPAGLGSKTGYATGDWYPRSQVPPSPLAGQLGLVEWDSLPPLLGLVQLGSEDADWAAVTARLGRRGVSRPILIGRDSARVRLLTTTGAGLWRWAFRGGASREAYRTLLAAGIDWLLGAEPRLSASRIKATAVAVRDQPIVFEWLTTAQPDSAFVSIASLTGDSGSTALLRFDAQGKATHHLPPGVYRWGVRGETGASGLTVVEQYSAEYLPRRVAVGSGGTAQASALMERFARERWLLFVVVVLALAAEWGWRHMRGLP